MERRIIYRNQSAILKIRNRLKQGVLAQRFVNIRCLVNEDLRNAVPGTKVQIFEVQYGKITNVDCLT